MNTTITSLPKTVCMAGMSYNYILDPIPYEHSYTIAYSVEYPDWLSLQDVYDRNYGGYRIIASGIPPEEGRIPIAIMLSDIWGNNTIQNFVLHVYQNSDYNEKYTLYQNYPNPFNEITRFDFYLVQDTQISFEIYSSTGKLDAVLYQGLLTKGIQQIIWNARGFSSGVYFYQIRTPQYNATKKCILLR